VGVKVIRPCGTRARPASVPNTETSGYCRFSLREQERMSAVPTGGGVSASRSECQRALASPRGRQIRSERLQKRGQTHPNGASSASSATRYAQGVRVALSELTQQWKGCCGAQKPSRVAAQAPELDGAPHRQKGQFGWRVDHQSWNEVATSQLLRQWEPPQPEERTRLLGGTLALADPHETEPQAPPRRRRNLAEKARSLHGSFLEQV
jgi:hypothetical protein